MDFDWKNSALDSALAELRQKEASNVIFGAGAGCRPLLKACAALDIAVAAVCDNSPDAAKTIPPDIPFLAPPKAAALPGPVNFILSVLNLRYLHEIVEQLRALGITACFDGRLIASASTAGAEDGDPFPFLFELVHNRYHPGESGGIPPRWESIPPAERRRFLMDGRVQLEHLYLDDRPGLPLSISGEEYKRALSLLDTGSFSYYGDTVSLFQDAFERYPITGKTVLVFGLNGCNCDAIALWQDAARVIVVDYNKPLCDHERVEVVTHAELFASGIKADCAISFSSFEHDGLGRYGDPVSPDGDLIAMRDAAKVVVPGGILFFGVPIGSDRLCWNAHRVYGSVRLPLLLENWDFLAAYGNADLAARPWSQPLLVLRNAGGKGSPPQRRGEETVGDSENLALAGAIRALMHCIRKEK